MRDFRDAAGAVDVSALLTDQASRWAASDRVLVEHYLEQYPTLRDAPTVLIELILREAELRAGCGETVTPEEYASRFPDLADVLRATLKPSAAPPAPSRTGPYTPGGSDPTGQYRPGAGPALSPPGQLIGRYRVTATLGAGSFGTVYLAFDDQLQRLVAVKTTDRQLVDTPDRVEEYLAEARNLARLDHPAVVPVYDCGVMPDGRVYVVSKYVEGTDLARRLKTGRLPFAEAAEIVATLAEALDHAHARGIIHRDVKPGNILLDAAGRPYLADFGLALRDEEYGTGPQWAGTPAYMSPEQARGETHLVDGRSDVFAVGVVFYELLAGVRPFRAEVGEDLFDRIISFDPPPPRRVDPAVPTELDRVCAKALQKRAADRYPTAAAMAADLRLWLAGAGGGGEPEPAAPAAAPRLVPKGLRAFDAGDADFFLDLLPGAKDRTGLPESVRFWLAKLDAADPDEALRVGLLYGPSGCGKSSLLRAGLIPRLSDRVLPVYAEAAAGDTEERLLRTLRRRCPGLPSGLDLPQAVASLRRGRGLPPGKRVVLFLDQFEQWLAAGRAEPDATLVRAVRQCDGRHVGCVMLVRDDFWMAATRFFRAVEVPVVEGENAAAVDLFDDRHARKVLADFGRSYGTLPAGEPGGEQQAFVEKAVRELAADGKVVPVRLALFAEMVKARPWTPATLRAVGGAGGVGVAFLEQTFGDTASPEHRLHAPAARAVLQALLPDLGGELKGHRRTHGELIEASGYRDRPDAFAQLVRILDTELRLITPSQAADGGAAGADADGYQLTHDYLVAAIRDWLAGKQRETRRGRAMLRLADAAAGWAARPDTRRLPSLLEWASIRLYTHPHQWTPTQAGMMRRATRHHLTRTGLAAAAGVVGLTAAAATYGYLQVGGKVEAVRTADAATLPKLIGDLEPYRFLVGGRLRAAAAEAPPDSVERLNLAVALLPQDPGQMQYVLDRLPTAPPETVLVIRDALRPHPAAAGPLWEVVEGPAPPDRLVRAAVVLAALAPADPRWAGLGTRLGEALVAENVLRVGYWTAAMQPVRAALTDPLAAVFRDERRSKADRDRALALVIGYAADRPALLAELATVADPDQFATLLPHLRNHTAEATQFLREFLAKEPQFWPPAPGTENHPAADPAAVKEVVAAHGMVTDAFALCQTLPLDRLQPVLDQLGKAGYRPTCIRPYTAADITRVAVAWTRDTGDTRSVTAATADELTRRDAEMKQAGFRPVDVAGYPAGGGVRYAAVWSNAGPPPETRLAVGLAEEAYQKTSADLAKEKFSPLVHHVHAAPTGDTHAAIWVKELATADGEFTGDESAFQYALLSGKVPADVCVSAAPMPPRPGRATYEAAVAARDEALKKQPNDPTLLLERGEFHYLLGRDDKAVNDLTAAIDRGDLGIRVDALRLRAFAHARQGRAGESDKDRAAFKQLEPDPAGLILNTDAVAAALAGRPDEADRLLDDRLRQFPHDGSLQYEAARAYALIARETRPKNPAAADRYRDRAAELLRASAANRHPYYGRLTTENDLENFYDHPAFPALIAECGLDRQYAVAWAKNPDYHTAELRGTDPHELLTWFARLAADKYRPVRLSAATTGPGRRFAATAVWVRPVGATAVVEADARRRAQAATVLARLGPTDHLGGLLAHAPDPGLRSQLIHTLPRLGTDPQLLARLVAAERNVSARRALVLALGEFTDAQLPAAARAEFAGTLNAVYRSDPDPGLHSAAEWVLRKWGTKPAPPAPTPPPPADRPGWYATGQGQTMVVIPGPVTFTRGSPPHEAGRHETELPYECRIPRSFAVSATKVTIDQYEQFLVAKPKYRKTQPPLPNGHPDWPRTSVEWFEAARYCRWLSEVEKVPESEMCFPPLEKIAIGMELPPDYLRRTGYRLPTEAEWEYAVRAGAATSRCYGTDDLLLGKYAWYQQAGNELRRVGLLKPNDFGLFDAHGAAFDWCADFPGLQPPTGWGGPADDGDLWEQLIGRRVRLLKGGGVATPAESVRASYRNRDTPAGSTTVYGFRLVRTLPATK